MLKRSVKYQTLFEIPAASPFGFALPLGHNVLLWVFESEEVVRIQCIAANGSWRTTKD